MITSYKIEEKTKELALEKIMKDFNLSEKDFSDGYAILKKGKKIFYKLKTKKDA